MNGVYISLLLLLTLVISNDITSPDAYEDNTSDTSESQLSADEDDDKFIDPYPNRLGCLEECECRSVSMVCDGTIPEIIPSTEQDVLLREIPWLKLQNQKRFCHSNWNNVKKLEVVFKREYNYIVRGVFLENEIDCLEQLQSLTFRYAEIRFGKSTFSDLKNLEILDLSESTFNISNLNDIFAIPEILPNLTTLVLGGAYKYTPHLQLNQSLIENLSIRPFHHLDISVQTLEFYFDNVRMLCRSLKTLVLVESDLKVPNTELSRIVRKRDFCLCENKGADQLRGNREADQRLCFRYTDSTISLLLKSEISSF